MNTLLFLFTILSLVSLSQQATNDGFPPVLTILDIDVEVDEETRSRTQLGSTGAVLSCADPLDGDATRVYINRVSPNTPCGEKCFELEPCGILNGDANGTTEWCLFYLASQGSFSFSAVQIYTLTLTCTDDKEASDSAVMTVTIVPNTPPVFVPSSPLSVLKTINGLATAKGTTIYEVTTNDVNSDAVYYTMTTTPTTEYFDIVYTGGTIKATNDLRFFCEDKLSASIIAADSFNPAIGPLTVDVTLNPHNEPPVVNNLDTTVTVNENVGAGFVVLDLDIVDTTVYTQVTINLRSSTSAGLEMYEIDGTQLKTKLDPDYERADTRGVELFFDLDDGYCVGTVYYLVVNVNDINEQPLFSEDNSFLEVFEGNIDVAYGLYINDEDLTDTHTFSLSRANSFFGVDSTTGNIQSLSEIDIDPNVIYQDYDVYIKATDSGGLETDELHVLVRVYDANDNPPYFNSPPYVVAATDCTDPGSVIGTVEGADDDSDYNQNNHIYYGGSGGKFAVMATGEIVLTQACVDGEGFTGSATINDQGIYPGPLAGTSATVTMSCGPCPAFTVTPAPATTTGSTAGSTTTENVTTAAPPTTAVTTSSSNLDDMLPWLIPVFLGFLMWLLLTVLLLHRYCRNPCPRPVRPRQRQVKVIPRKDPSPPPRAKMPPPTPPKPRTPPPIRSPTPIPEPYLFGFWKETYTDQDQNSPPPRAEKPKAVENMPIGEGNTEPPEHLRLGPAGDNSAMPRFLPGREETPMTQEPLTPPQKRKWYSCRP